MTQLIDEIAPYIFGNIIFDENMKMHITKGAKLVITALIILSIYYLVTLKNGEVSSKKDVSSVQNAVDVNSKWGPWSEWGACSVTCGKGQRSSSRKCEANAGYHVKCEGSVEQFKDCHERDCSNDVAGLVDAKVAGKKVMVFSKTYCPFSTKAKQVFQKYLDDSSLSKEDYEVMELNIRQDGQLIQDYLLKLTGARTVPRVFIQGKFVGGGDETVAKDKSGELQTLLGIITKPKIPKRPEYSCKHPPLTCVTIDNIKDGDGKTFPKNGDTVRVHYIGTLADGKKFDSSRDRGEPFQFTMGAGQVIKGYDEGFKVLSLGQRAKLTISSDWAYGSRGFSHVIPPNAMLVFDVELLSVNSK